MKLRAAWIVLVLSAATGSCLARPSVDPTAETDLPLPDPVFSTPEQMPTEAAQEEGSPAGSLSFSPATYEDPSYGFAIDHPDSWETIGGTEMQSRGEITQLGEGDAVLLSISVLRWEPLDDLDAYLAQRRLAWDASGMKVVDEARATVDGIATVRLKVRGSDGEPALFAFAALPDRYLALSGPDSPLLQDVLGTLRFRAASSGADSPASTEGPLALDCQTGDPRSLDWAACNVIAAFLSRNTQPLLGYMSDPFGMFYWRSEGVSTSRDEALAEILNTRLPAAPAEPPVFSTDPGTIAAMADVAPASWLGPDVDLALTLYSRGWGTDGEDEAMLFFTRDEAGAYRWSHFFYAMGGFQR